MKRIALFVVVLAAGTVLSCRSTGDRPWRSPPPASSPAPTAAPAPSADYSDSGQTYSVKVVNNLVLDDQARGKNLELKVSYPATGAPHPVILFSHGAWSSKDEYASLVDYWARHGYVVFQVNHSDSKDYGGKPGPDSFKDWPNRPGDLSFILDSLDSIERRIPDLAGRMDRNIIGAGGHSFGGLTVQLMAGAELPRFAMKARGKNFRDDRISALLLMSPPGSGQVLNERSWKSLTMPRMTITGSNDISKRRGEGYEWRTEPYKYSPDDDNFLVVIDGADHGLGGTANPDNPYGWVNNDDQVRIVQIASLAFWNAYLKRLPSAVRKVSEGSDFNAGRVRGAVSMKGAARRLSVSGT